MNDDGNVLRYGNNYKQRVTDIPLASPYTFFNAPFLLIIGFTVQRLLRIVLPCKHKQTKQGNILESMNKILFAVGNNGFFPL